MTLRLDAGARGRESLFDAEGVERLADLVDVADPVADVETQVARSLQATSARREVGQLPPPLQVVVDWLYGLSGVQRSHEDVANRLGMPVAEVLRLEASALAKLRAGFEPDPVA